MSQSRGTTMNNAELLILHEEMWDKTREIMKKKNVDYSGGSTDPFANFRGSLNYGVESEIGIAIRIGDKLKRVEAYIKNGALAVQDESALDSILDGINYLILMAGLIHERQYKNKNKNKKAMALLPDNPSHFKVPSATDLDEWEEQKEEMEAKLRNKED
jgi:hypothetical protein